MYGTSGTLRSPKSGVLIQHPDQNPKSGVLVTQLDHNPKNLGYAGDTGKMPGTAAAH